jgi:hypothetical protein
MKIAPPAFPTNLNSNTLLGMTLRDYFAAAALCGFAAQGGNINQMAEDAYDAADAMIKAREA